VSVFRTLGGDLGLWFPVYHTESTIVRRAPALTLYKRVFLSLSPHTCTLCPMFSLDPSVVGLVPPYTTASMKVSNNKPFVESNLLGYKSHNTISIPKQFIRNNVHCYALKLLALCEHQARKYVSHARPTLFVHCRAHQRLRVNTSRRIKRSSACYITLVTTVSNCFVPRLPGAYALRGLQDRTCALCCES